MLKYIKVFLLNAWIFAFLLPNQASGETRLGPFWSDFPQMSEGKVSTSKGPTSLQGRSFLFVPAHMLAASAIYDRRMLLSFTDDTLTEKSAAGVTHWPIIYTPDGSFQIEHLVGGTILSNKEGRSDFSAYEQYGQHLTITYDGGIVGFARALSSAEETRFSQYLDTVEKEATRHSTESLARASSGPLDQIDVFEMSRGQVVEWIYHGEFSKLRPKRRDGENALERFTNALAVSTELDVLFQNYHQVYYEQYGFAPQARAASGEEWWKLQETIASVDGWGNQVSSTQNIGPPIYVRAQFKDTYKQFNPGGAVGLSSRFSGAPPEYFTTFLRFLNKYKHASPATVRHFEENLQRLMHGQSPVTIARPDIKDKLATLDLPWETRVPERSDFSEVGVSWVTPVDWERTGTAKTDDFTVRYNLGYFSSYGLGSKVSVRGSHISEPIDLLRRINFWLDRDGQETVIFLDDVDMEKFTIGGRTAYYLEFGNVTYALVEDGSQNWLFGIQGSDAEVSKHRPQFREFLNSVKFSAAPPQPQADPAAAPDRAAANRADSRRSQYQEPPAKKASAPQKAIGKPYLKLKSKSDRIALINAWIDEILFLTGQKKIENEYSFLGGNLNNRLDGEFRRVFTFGFKDDIFSRYFGEPYSELSDREKQKIFKVLDQEFLGDPLIKDQLAIAFKTKKSGGAYRRWGRLITEINAAQPSQPLVENIPGYTGAREAGTVWTNSIGMEFAYIPAGEFMMGNPDIKLRTEAKWGRFHKWDDLREPVSHRVRLTKPFMMQTAEVTRRHWKTVMETDPEFKRSDVLPKSPVGWGDALKFVRRLSQLEGRAYRLPTEAEWEYAARAGTTTNYYWGDAPRYDLANIGNGNPRAGAKGNEFIINRGLPVAHPSPVKSFAPNPWGLYDMIGNVSEWNSDSSGARSNSEFVTDPLHTRPKRGDVRILITRGCSYSSGLNRGGCTSFSRYERGEDDDRYSVGFRVVLDSFEGVGRGRGY